MAFVFLTLFQESLYIGKTLKASKLDENGSFNTN